MAPLRLFKTWLTDIPAEFNDDSLVPVVFYTSVTKLPSWQDYFRGAESQSFAVSLDKFQTWQKFPGNPVLALPPIEWNVTGWRDPFIFQDKYLDSFFGDSLPRSKYYMLLGSGIQGYGGAVDIYHSDDLVNWEPFKLPLITIAHDDTERFLPYGYKTFSWGSNWEVPNLLRLNNDDDGENGPLYLIFFGTEGNASYLPGHHVGMYLVGHLEKREKPSFGYNPDFVKQQGNASLDFMVEFKPVFSGFLDHGLAYAANSVRNLDHDSNEIMLLAWANEDRSVEKMISSGYAGCIVFPRLYSLDHENNQPILKVKAAPESLNVRKASKTVSFSSIQDSDKSPSAIFSSKNKDGPYIPPPLIPSKPNTEGQEDIYVEYYPINGVTNGKKLDMDVTMSFICDSNCTSSDEYLSGLVIHHSAPFRKGQNNDEAFKEYTLITIKPSQEKIDVSRWKSSITEGSSRNELYMITPMKVNETERLVKLRVVLDGSLLEVYANDRSVLTTRIYPSTWEKLEPETSEGTYLGFISSKQKGIVDKWRTNIEQLDVYINISPTSIDKI
jgi:beta-fructofuranosidase